MIDKHETKISKGSVKEALPSDKQYKITGGFKPVLVSLQ